MCVPNSRASEYMKQKSERAQERSRHMVTCHQLKMNVRAASGAKIQSTSSTTVTDAGAPSRSVQFFSYCSPETHS